MCKKCPTPEFQSTLHDLIRTAQRHPVSSLDRNKALTRIIRMIRPLLKVGNHQDQADVLQNLWVFFVQNLDRFDPNYRCLVTWLNSHLFYRHRDAYHAYLTQKRLQVPLDSTLSEEDGLSHKVMADVPSRDYGSLEMLDRVVEWVQTDPTGILRQTHLEGHPEINAQVVIQLRLPLPEMPWKEMATQFGKPIPTLNTFYSRRCLPLLRQFGESEGFLCSDRS